MCPDGVCADGPTVPFDAFTFDASVPESGPGVDAPGLQDVVSEPPAVFPDVSVDVGGFDEGPPPVDAPAETSPPDGGSDERNLDGPAPDNVIPCGGGMWPALYCVPPTGECCEVSDDAGGARFTCVTDKASCTGYPIECRQATDCMGDQICCHYTSAMKCETPDQASGTCPSGSSGPVSQACDPLLRGECPGGQSCDGGLVNQGLPSPYIGCN
jgi:hypothetical protein